MNVHYFATPMMSDPIPVDPVPVPDPIPRPQPMPDPPPDEGPIKMSRYKGRSERIRAS